MLFEIRACFGKQAIRSADEPPANLSIIRGTVSIYSLCSLQMTQSVELDFPFLRLIGKDSIIVSGIKAHPGPSQCCDKRRCN